MTHKNYSRQLGPKDTLGRCPHGEVQVLGVCASCEIADLQRRLRKAQEERDRLKQAIRNPAGYRNQTMPTKCPLCGLDGNTEAERDAAIERGEYLFNEAIRQIRGWRGAYDAAHESGEGWYKRAEAAERDVSTLQQDVGRAEQELELANKEAAEQRAGDGGFVYEMVEQRNEALRELREQRALAEQRGALIDAIIRSVEQGKELWMPELRAKSGIPELEETPCPGSDGGHCDHWYDDEGPCCRCGDDVLRLEGVPAEVQEEGDGC